MAIIKINVDMIYPIGSIYMSTVNNSPSKWIGGTWERIQGRFLFGADENQKLAGTEGGEENHILMMDEMPKHKHRIITWRNPTEAEPQITSGFGATRDDYAFSNVASAGDGTVRFSDDFSGLGFSGSNIAHNNMPPYLSVYIWKRIA